MELFDSTVVAMHPRAFDVTDDYKQHAELVCLAAVARLIIDQNVRVEFEQRTKLIFFSEEHVYVYALTEVPDDAPIERGMWRESKRDPKGVSLTTIVADVSGPGAWKSVIKRALVPAVQQGYFVEEKGAGIIGRFRKVQTPVPERVVTTQHLIDPVRERMQLLERNPQLHERIVADIASGLRAAASDGDGASGSSFGGDGGGGDGGGGD